MDLPILILAAGQSTRMRGADKLLVPIDGMPLLRRQVEMALSVSRNVYVALRSLNDARAALVAATLAHSIHVPDADHGMSVSLRSGVAALPPCPAFMVFLADLVALEAADLERVFAARAIYPDKLVWRGATQAGKAGHPIVFDKKLRPEFAQLSGDTGGAPILQTFHKYTQMVPLQDSNALWDLDTPEDFAAWRARSSTSTR